MIEPLNQQKITKNLTYTGIHVKSLAKYTNHKKTPQTSILSSFIGMKFKNISGERFENDFSTNR